MNSPTPEQGEAFSALAARKEGQVVREYLQGCLQQQETAMRVQTDGVQLRMSQGRAQVLAKLLEYWKP